MTVLLLFLTAVICYALGNVSGCMLLSRCVFKKHRGKYSAAGCAVGDFYKDFGPVGAAALIAFEILKAVLAVLIGGWLLGIKDQAEVGRAFAAFCLLMGQYYPVLFLFKGGKSVLCAGIAVLMLDWRVGLCCWVAYIVVIIFTRYTALGSTAAAVLAPIFVWIFDVGGEQSGLLGTLSLLCALLVITRWAENLVRIAGGTEPKAFDLAAKSKRTDEFEDEAFGDEDDGRS